MSDIDRKRMIPLHIADQAVAACDAEIAKLREENARLKAEVERLSKPAIIGGYNISEYIRMANSETLEFDNGDIFADMTLPERIKYIVESHARLKAEVERLDTLCKQLGKQHSDISCENIMLRKAGDGLYKSMLEIGCNEMADNFQHDAWWGSMNAWKETKPHA
jgi:cell division protein FtsB